MVFYQLLFRICEVIGLPMLSMREYTAGYNCRDNNMPVIPA
jgi:hypothetical protein